MWHRSGTDKEDVKNSGSVKGGEFLERMSDYSNKPLLTGIQVY
jgi:hypothetical protein